MVCSAANFGFEKTDPGHLHAEFLLEPEATTTLESGIYDAIETTLATTEMMCGEDLQLHDLEARKVTETEIVKATNRQATTVEAEVEVLEEIDHPISVVHQVVK